MNYAECISVRIIIKKEILGIRLWRWLVREKAIIIRCEDVFYSLLLFRDELYSTLYFLLLEKKPHFKLYLNKSS